MPHEVGHENLVKSVFVNSDSGRQPHWRGQLEFGENRIVDSEIDPAFSAQTAIICSLTTAPTQPKNPGDLLGSRRIDVNRFDSGNYLSC